MNELSNFLVESILFEDGVKNKVVVYAGRFQPFHRGHYHAYKHLVNKFGKDNVYIGTSDKTDQKKSPFRFSEKKMIMTTMFDIPSNKIVQVKNPYAPVEVLNRYNAEDTAFITSVGGKDANRLAGKYFKPYKDGAELDGYKKQGYIYVTPMGTGGANISGTESRRGLRTGSLEDKKKFFTDKVYGKFNKKIFDFIVNRLASLPEITKEYVYIPEHIVERWLINNPTIITEISSITGHTEIDDGPNYVFPDIMTYDVISRRRAERLGLSVLNQLVDGELGDIEDYPLYPKGPVKAVTPYPAGVAGKITATNQKDYYGSEAYRKWFNHVTRAASLVGYSLVGSLEGEKDKKISIATLRSEKGIMKESADVLNEIQKGIYKGKIKIDGNPVEIEVELYGVDNKNNTFLTKVLGVPSKYKNRLKIGTSLPIPARIFRRGEWLRVKTPSVFEQELNEIPMSDLVKINQYADKQMNPVDVVITHKHFFDRLNDPRNVKPISQAELVGFFKRLSKNKEEFIEFLKKYGEVVAKDNRTNINIPFMKQANKIIGKTIMRKPDFKTSNQKFKFENINKGYAIFKVQYGKKNWLTDINKNDSFGRFDSSLKYSDRNVLKFTKERAISLIKKNKHISDKFGIVGLDGKQFIVEAINESSITKQGILKYYTAVCKAEGYKPLPVNFGRVSHGGAVTTFNPKTFKPLSITFDLNRMLDPEYAVLHELTHQIMLEKFKDPFIGKRDQLAKFKKVENGLIEKYTYSHYSNLLYENLMIGYAGSDDVKKFSDRSKKLRTRLDKEPKEDRSYSLNHLKESANRLKINIPNHVKSIHTAFKREGKKLYIVGGAVRDAILGQSPKDFDLATDAKPDEVLNIANKHGFKSVEVGKSFGVVVINGEEIATFRKDIGKGRRPQSVHYADIEADVRRRDLTINALFYDLDTEEIVDLVGGIADLKNNKVRAVGNAIERFDEDALRKLRALRFAAKLGSRLDKDIETALKADPSLPQVSPERIRDEFVKSLKTAKSQKNYLNMLHQFRMMQYVLPGIPVSPTDFIDDKNYILVIAHLLKDRKPSDLYKQLNKLTYTVREVNDIVFLVRLSNFKPDDIITMKRLHEVVKLSDDDIIRWGKLVGKSFTKFVKFKLTVSGNDMLKLGLKGKAIGDEILRREKELYGESLITEGGAYGHLNHPFEIEVNLTFGQLKDIVDKALDGELGVATVKTDGQALAISWRDGKLIAARNKSHLKNRGENALDAKALATKFSGRGELEKAYNFAMRDLTKAIGSLSEKQRNKIFKEGACFMNLEVIYPTSVNVIPYGQALLVFHGTMEYDMNGVAIGENVEAGRILAGMIKQVNQNVQDAYTIQGPPVTKLPKNKKLSSLKGTYKSQINKLQSEFKLKDSDGLAEYHKAWWSDYVDKNAPSKLNNDVKIGLVRRWALFDKSFRLDNKNISDDKVLNWAKGIDKNDHSKIFKQNARKFEDIFLHMGAEVLSFMSSALTVNPNKALRAIKDRLDKTIKDIKASGDASKIQKLKNELERLEAAGGVDKIVPIEGIVFRYPPGPKGHTLKLTGTFASLNALLGIMFY